MTYTTQNVKTFCIPNPRRNLPGISSRRRGESGFSRAFQRAFLLTETHGLGGHEFELPGYGIADFVWAKADSVGPERTTANQRLALAGSVAVTSFEMKLSDWRRALRQAYRYTYFSDRAIVVLPPETVQAAKGALVLFKEMGVGLWGFEKKTGNIAKLFTPRARRPKNPAARERAIQLLRWKFNLSSPGKQS